MVRTMPAPIRLMVFEGYQPGYGFFNSFGALTRPLLQRGSRGPAVEELQRLLEEKLQQSIGVDGQFGTRTFNAVLEFQRMYGGVLRVDGVVGADTWTALLGQEVQISSIADTPDRPPIRGGPAEPPAAPPSVNEGDMTVGDTAPAKMNKPLLIGAAAVVAALFLLRK